MPRPKRSKITPSAPAALPELMARAARHASSQSSNSDSTGVLTRKPANKVKRGVGKDRFLMSGALKESLVQEKKNAQSTPTTHNRSNRVSSGNEDLEQILVPSSHPLVSPKIQLPTTAQKPIPQKSAMPSANWRAQATPQPDSSILALGNFKRRSRQPSLLGIGRQDDSLTFSSLGGEDPFYEDLDDFDPVVATPIVPASNTKAKMNPSSPQIAPLSLSSSSCKRKITPPEPQADILVRRSPSLTVEEADRIFGSSPALPATLELDDEPELPGPIQQAATPPEVWSETNAPPQSSSPSRFTQTATIVRIPSPSPKKRGRPRRQPVESKTRGANKKNKTRNEKSKPLQPLSTAELQSFLPRRKTNVREEYDFPDGEEIEFTVPRDDEDELSFVPVRKKSKRGTNASNPVKTPSRRMTSAKDRDRPRLIDKTNLRPSNTKGKVLSAQPGTKTYSRGGNKENLHQDTSDSTTFSDALSDAPDEDTGISNTTIDDLDEKGKNELKTAARKFAEVDQWEMEFEEVTASSSSPKDAR